MFPPDQFNASRAAAIKAVAPWEQMEILQDSMRGISYERVSDNMYNMMTDELARKVVDRVKRDNVQYDAVIIPMRGGVRPGEKVADALSLHYGSEIMKVPIGIRRYDKVYGNGEAEHMESEIYYPVGVELSKTARLLIVDEVNDTSVAARDIRKHLFEKFGIDKSHVDLAVVHEKPSRRNEQALDVVRETDAWIVYQDENSPEPRVIQRPWLPFDVMYKSNEFWRGCLADLMINEQGTMRWHDVMDHFMQLGFKENELPSLEDSDFMQDLMNKLELRFKEIAVSRRMSEDGFRILQLDLFRDDNE